MKKHAVIRLLLMTIIVMATALVVASNRTEVVLTDQEECTQQEANECGTKNSEFLLETLTRNLLNR